MLPLWIASYPDGRLRRQDGGRSYQLSLPRPGKMAAGPTSVSIIYRVSIDDLFTSMEVHTGHHKRKNQREDTKATRAAVLEGLQERRAIAITEPDVLAAQFMDHLREVTNTSCVYSFPPQVIRA